MDRGLSSQSADRAIQNAINNTYRVHNRSSRLVRKGSFITSVNLGGGMKVGEEVLCNGKIGVIVAKRGDYVDVVSQDMKEHVHERAVISKSDGFMFNGHAVMWDRLDQVSRGAILAKHNLDFNYLMKKWEYLPAQIKGKIKDGGIRKSYRSEHVNVGDHLGSLTDDLDQYYSAGDAAGIRNEIKVMDDVMYDSGDANAENFKEAIAYGKKLLSRLGKSNRGKGRRGF